jgi:hypothetical protein
MAQVYEGGAEVHPGAGIPGQEVLGEWTRSGRRVRWGPCAGGWWAQSAASIGDWPWRFTDRPAAERAVAAMLAEYPADEWTPAVSGGAGAEPAG